MTWKVIEPDNDFWDASIGDVLEGEIVGIHDTQYGKGWSIEQYNKKKIRTPAHKHLQNTLKQCNMSDKVRIEYVKDVPTTKGAAMRVYKVQRWVEE